MSTPYGSAIKREIEEHAGLKGGKRKMDKKDLLQIQIIVGVAIKEYREKT